MKKILVVFSYNNIPCNTRAIENIIIPCNKVGLKHTEKWINNILRFIESNYYDNPKIINVIELEE